VAAKNAMANFRSAKYSAGNGGFHAVEIWLEKQPDTWQFNYMTKFYLYR